MDNFVRNATNDINVKLDWAIRSFDKLMSNKKDKNEIQDNFWSFLTAFQTPWFYYNRLIKELTPELSDKKRKELSVKVINAWKSTELSENERISWDILQDLRNEDTHIIPIKTNYEIKIVVLTDFDDVVLTDYDGTPLISNSEEIFVIFNQKEYGIECLAKNGIESVKKLIEYLPNINNWC
jgi:hypothetical protein